MKIYFLTYVPCSEEQLVVYHRSRVRESINTWWSSSMVSSICQWWLMIQLIAQPSKRRSCIWESCHKGEVKVHYTVGIQSVPKADASNITTAVSASFPKTGWFDRWSWEREVASCTCRHERSARSMWSPVPYQFLIG